MGSESSTPTEETPKTIPKSPVKKTPMSGSTRPNNPPVKKTPAPRSARPENPPVKKTPVPGSARPKNPPAGINDGKDNGAVTQSRTDVVKEPVPSSPRHQRSKSPRLGKLSPTVLSQQHLAVVNKERSSPVISTKPVTPVPAKEQSFSVSSAKPVILVPTTGQSFAVLDPKSSSSASLKERLVPSSHRSALPNTRNIIIPASSFQRAPLVRLNYIPRSSHNKSTHTHGPDKITIIHRTSLGSNPYGLRWYEHGYNQNT